MSLYAKAIRAQLTVGMVLTLIKDIQPFTEVNPATIPKLLIFLIHRLGFFLDTVHVRRHQPQLYFSLKIHLIY